MTDHEVPSLGRRIEAAVTAAIGRAVPELAGADPVVRRSERAGVDVQSNAALALAARVGRAPADLAADIVRELADGDTGGEVSATVSPPGFVNLTVHGRTIWTQLGARLADDRLGVGAPLTGQRTVIDYSGPNVAKEMHVGHLRSTIIGDSLARILGHLGADVVRENHLGDWGTQFGMLIQYLDEHPDTSWRHDQVDGGTSTVSALEGLYRRARADFDDDPAFAGRSRRRVVALQSGDEPTLACWREIVHESEVAFQAVYRRLGVLLTPQDSVGESFYNPMLGDVVAELESAGIAVPSEGAVCVFTPGFVGRDDRPTPLIVRKADGGHGYATTDLATIRHRLRERGADRILYLVDARQALHFRMVFATARRAGWVPEGTELVHLPFGTVLGPDGRPFKTRSGDTVRLVDLLDMAVERARGVVAEKSPELDAAELDRIAALVGVGAVKYAELSTSAARDYVFDPDRMVSLTGNTGVYLQYAHARVCSILRRADGSGHAVSVDPDAPLAPAERVLGLALDAFGDTLTDVATGSEPHRLCLHLYEVARAFSVFYELCDVLRAPDPLRGNRLALCQLTAGTLRRGLGLLGVAAPERL
ncbi:MAG: arginine--tRNA ligase [Actinocatenispora sp.]